MSDVRPTAFVSWAHSAQNWDQAEAKVWEKSVAQFTSLLCISGIEADVDLYHLSEPGIDWTRFGPEAIGRNDFVLAVVSSAWIKRFEGTEDPLFGAGAARESDALLSIYHENREEFLQKLALVYLPGTDDLRIPQTLAGVSRFTLSTLTLDNIEELIRYLFRSPSYVRPELGPKPPYLGSTADNPTNEIRRVLSALVDLGGEPQAQAAAAGISDALDASAARHEHSIDLGMTATSQGRPDETNMFSEPAAEGRKLFEDPIELYPFLVQRCADCTGADERKLDVLGLTLASAWSSMKYWLYRTEVRGWEIVFTAYTGDSPEVPSWWSTESKQVLADIERVRDDAKIIDKGISLELSEYAFVPGVHGYRLGNGDMFASFVTRDGLVLSDRQECSYEYISAQEDTPASLTQRRLFESWFTAAMT